MSLEIERLNKEIAAARPDDLTTHYREHKDLSPEERQTHIWRVSTGDEARGAGSTTVLHGMYLTLEEARAQMAREQAKNSDRPVHLSCQDPIMLALTLESNDNPKFKAWLTNQRETPDSVLRSKEACEKALKIVSQQSPADLAIRVAIAQYESLEAGRRIHNTAYDRNPKWAAEKHLSKLQEKFQPWVVEYINQLLKD